MELRARGRLPFPVHVAADLLVLLFRHLGPMHRHHSCHELPPRNTYGEERRPDLFALVCRGSKCIAARKSSAQVPTLMMMSTTTIATFAPRGKSGNDEN